MKFDAHRNYYILPNHSIFHAKNADINLAKERCHNAQHSNTCKVQIDEPAPNIPGVMWVELENHIPDYVLVIAVPEESI